MMAVNPHWKRWPSFEDHQRSPCLDRSPIRHRIGHVQSSGILKQFWFLNSINAFDVTPKLTVKRTSSTSEYRLFCSAMICQHCSVSCPYRCPERRNPRGRKNRLRLLSNELNAESALDATRNIQPHHHCFRLVLDAEFDGFEKQLQIPPLRSPEANSSRNDTLGFADGTCGGLWRSNRPRFGSSGELGF